MQVDEKLIAAGGQPVAGTVYLNREAMGRYGPDGFVLTEAGEKWAASAPAEPSKPAKPAAKKAAKAPEPDDALDGIDELMGE